VEPVDEQHQALSSLADIPIWDYHSPMRIVAIKALREFWHRYPDAKAHLEAWIDETRKADWNQPADIKGRFHNASILKNRCVAFDIKGNSYRLIVAAAYRYGAIYIKFIGTHEEYDAIDAETMEMEP
jgi:mRNA interferase HigB